MKWAFGPYSEENIMVIKVCKSKASKLARCLMNNEMVEIIGCRVVNDKVFYDVDAPDFFVFPDWVEVQG